MKALQFVPDLSVWTALNKGYLAESLPIARLYEALELTLLDLSGVSRFRNACYRRKQSAISLTEWE
ncbi:MAG: hypothetical protein AAF806_13695 [Bacteroidota bacterium]